MKKEAATATVSAEPVGMVDYLQAEVMVAMPKAEYDGLKAENARLKRQLAKAAEVISSARYRDDFALCPGSFNNLGDAFLYGKELPDCKHCWQQALNSIE